MPAHLPSLVIAILSASLLGSFHCAGMCGAFLAIAVRPDAERTPAWALQMLYHLGRLTTYALLGAVAGLVGASLDLGARLAGVQQLAAAIAAGTLVVFGLVTLIRLWGAHVPKLPQPAWLQRFSIAAHRAAMNLPGPARAGAVGLLTTLLPCGWLYAFVLVAAGTAHAGLGVIVMFVFWLGTLPILIALGAGLRAATGALGRHLPLVTALALVLVGSWSLITRTNRLDAILTHARPAIDVLHADAPRIASDHCGLVR
jgi:sulfite exporter TauE/SafE